MKNLIYFMLLFTIILISSCGLPTADEVGLSFSTQQSPVPENLQWREIGFAKELINQKDMVVVISGGSNPLPLENWTR